MNLKDKIIAFDLDGTLVRNDTFPSAYTYQEINRLIQEGYHITLITGRAPISSREIYEKCNMQMISVHNNGALVYDFHTKTKIRNVTIPMDIIHSICENPELKTLLNDVVVEIDDKVYSNFGNVLWNDKVIVGPFSKTLPEEPNSLLLYAKNKEDQSKMASIINKREDYHYRYWGFMGEFYNCNFSKKEGAEEILKYYGKNASDLIYFGDAENDIELLQYAGIGVAMANATDDVKKNANQVTSFTNEEDGAIKHLLSMIEEDK